DPLAHAVVARGRRAAARLPPSTARMLAAALRHTVTQYGRIITAVPDVIRLARAAGAALLSSSEAKKVGAPSEKGTGIPIVADNGHGSSLEKIARSLRSKIPSGIALGPRTPLNVAISPGRSFAGTRIPLAEAKAIARHFDAKLNDVVLATCAGALRRHFGRDQALFAKPMIGAVPASLRMPGDASQGNLVTMMLVNMGTDIADPRKRLAAIVAASTKAKTITGGIKSVIPTDMPSLGIPWLMSVIAPLYRLTVKTSVIPVVANLVVSNVPGPQVPMYMAGAAMRAYFPVSIVIHGLALNITIISYNGSMDYGLIACKKAVAKLPQFAEHLQAAHRELLDIVTSGQAKAGAAGVLAKAAPRRKRTATAGTEALKTKVRISAEPVLGARSMAGKRPGAKAAARKKHA
ncbi:MAG: WS/DGAT domain-containing protein, partial [Acidobacteriota bacterium]